MKRNQLGIRLWIPKYHKKNRTSDHGKTVALPLSYMAPTSKPNQKGVKYLTGPKSQNWHCRIWTYIFRVHNTRRAKPLHLRHTIINTRRTKNMKNSLRQHNRANWIWTSEYSSQSDVPYRLAIALYYGSNLYLGWVICFAAAPTRMFLQFA